MGLFSATKKTYVSSAAYNMAGDEDDRPQYLQSLVVQNVLSGTKASMGESLTAGYLHGPGIRLRSFYRWATTPGNYDNIGMPYGFLQDYQNVDTTVIAGEIPTTAGTTALLQSAELGPADWSYWAERWMLQFHPTQIDLAWTADYNETTNLITITLPDTSVWTFTPTSPSFNSGAKYIYATYSEVSGTSLGPVDTGTTHTLDPGDPWPDTTDYTTISDVTTPHPITLNTTVRTIITYSDGSPGSDNTVVTPASSSWDERHAEFQKTIYDGMITIGDVTYQLSTKYFLYFDQVFDEIVEDETTEVVEEDMGGGVTKTTTTITTVESVALTRTYREDTQEVFNKGWSDLKSFIYLIGSGNATLDALVNTDGDLTNQFLPFIPVRIENQFLSDSYIPVAYNEAKKAYKKAMRDSFDKLIEKISDNDDLGDIDFAYLVFGVSLNVKENQCKKYLYYFFKNLMDIQNQGALDFSDWLVQINNYRDAKETWNVWRQAQESTLHPLFGTPEPPVPPQPTLPTNVVRMANTGTVAKHFDFRITWNYVREFSGLGLGKPGAKKGEYWFQQMGKLEYQPPDIILGNNTITPDKIEVEQSRLYWQETDGSYKYLQLEGLYHNNYVYNGKAVGISMSEALDDTDESGFIVPLHYPTYKEVSLMSGTQMATAACFVVFNCYKIVKQKWYQKGIFKVLFVIAFAIASVVFTGGAGLGLLGTNAFVGSALGFTGLTGAIIGSIANAMAALILSTLIEKTIGSLGGILGSVLGSLFSILAGAFIQGFQAGFNFNWGDLMKAENLFKLTDALSSGYTAYVQGTIEDMAKESADLMKEYQTRSEEISKLYEQNIGYANNIIDPLMFTNDQRIYVESGDTFLTRTLMTGTEIANMSFDMLSGFTDLTLALPTVYS